MDHLAQSQTCVRLVPLSGGYAREEANEILSKQKGVIASFSRALLEGLTCKQEQADFDKVLAATVDGIYEASKSGASGIVSRIKIFFV